MKILMNASISRVVFFLLFALTVFPVQAEERGPRGVARIGVFQFEPLNFMDEKGVAKGLYPDLLSEIVKDEKWTVEFVPGSWAEGLDRLQRGEIDLVLSVAYSPERAEIMDFTLESVAELWGQVFLKPNSKFKNINDLEGHRVAIMRKDISGSNFIATAENLGVHCEIVEFPTHAEVFAAVQQGKVDAGVAPQHFGLRHTKEYNLTGSTIMFSPFSIYFASKKGTQHELLSHIDAHLSRWKNEPDSFYYKRLGYWLGNQIFKTIVPTWFIYAVTISILSILIFASFSLILKRTVNRRTKELQESETRMRLFFERQIVGMAIISPEKSWLQVNDRLLQILGYSRDELLLLTWGELTHPEDIEMDSTQFNRLLSGEVDEYSLEKRFIRKDGAVILITLSVGCVRREDGSVDFIAALIDDITVRKQAEITIATEKERFELAMRSVNDGLYDWNLKTNEIYFSPVWKTMLGYEDHEIKNEFSEWERLTDPEDVKISWGIFNELIEGKRKNFEYESKMLHKDGHWVDILARARTIVDAEGNVTRFVGTHVDITERKQLEKGIQENEARYLSLFNSINSGVAIYKPVDNGEDFVFVNINEAAEKISFIKNEDVIGKRVLEVLPSLEKTDFISVLQQVYHTGIAVDMPEFRHVHGDGDKEAWRKNFIYKLPSGEVVAIYDDITKRKRLEESLLHAQKMESIGDLAGGIAHDFNNILSVIIGYAEMAKDDCQPGSSISKDLGEVLGASNRAKGLVQQILAFSRQHDTERIIVQPASIVEETITMLRPSLPTTIDITQDIDTATGPILIDPNQLNQILMNLCTNSFHAMEETGGKLGISLKEVILSSEDLIHEKDVADGTFIQISISDSGPGIIPSIKDKIFDPYFTTKEVGKGTGMGLAMVYGIAKSHGGFITLYSELGEGTVFHVFLPVEKQGKAPENEIVEYIPTGKERILFVDDEEILATMGKTMLERLGYHVTLRSNSLEALETFQNQPDNFDIVITDQTMPGMTGSDLSRRMLQIRPDIPIILCTGYSSIMSEEKAKLMGIKEFALKPLAKKDIAKMIRRVLDI